MARLSGIRKRLGGPVFAIADQCIYSASQLLLSFALARVLSPSDFGVASAFLAVVSFQYILHTAMVHEPLLIRRFYVSRSAAWTSWALVALFSLAGYLCWQLIVFPGQLRWVGVALIVGYEIFWLSRSLLLTGRRYAMLCATGVLVCVGYVAVLGVEKPATWGEALLLVSLLQLPFLVLVLLNLRNVMPALPAAKDAQGLTVKESMAYGWKASLSQFMSWIMTGGAILLLGSSADSEQGGLLKIYITFLLPMQYVLAALGYYLLPQLAGALACRRPPERAPALRDVRAGGLPDRRSCRRGAGPAGPAPRGAGLRRELPPHGLLAVLLRARDLRSHHVPAHGLPCRGAAGRAAVLLGRGRGGVRHRDAHRPSRRSRTSRPSTR
jgi:hypothetical protein